LKKYQNQNIFLQALQLRKVEIDHFMDPFDTTPNVITLPDDLALTNHILVTFTKDEASNSDMF